MKLGKYDAFADLMCRFCCFFAAFVVLSGTIISFYPGAEVGFFSLSAFLAGIVVYLHVAGKCVCLRFY